jgi:protein-S-isoprenylcysteine O-methyltransferase Ste14
VISNGPYRVLCHPSYELAFIGVGLMYGNWISVAALTLLPLIGIVNRIRVEEKALFSALGDDYRRDAQAADPVHLVAPEAALGLRRSERPARV